MLKSQKFSITSAITDFGDLSATGPCKIYCPWERICPVEWQMYSLALAERIWKYDDLVQVKNIIRKHSLL